MNDLATIDTTHPFLFALSVARILLKGLTITISAALIGFVFAAVLGLIFALLRRSAPKAISIPLAVFLEFIRDTPLLIQLFFLYYVLPMYGIRLPAFLTGALAIGLQYSAFMAEIYRGGIDAIDKGQWEAAISLNLGIRQTYRDIVIPQAVPRIIPALGNCLVAMLKETPILSTISVLEMMNLAITIGDRTYQYTLPLSMAGILMLLVTGVFASLVRVVEITIPRRGISLR